MNDDPINQQLRALVGSLPSPRLGLTEEEKDRLVQVVGGPRTVRGILKAKDELAPKRIPFVFSSLDTQAVVDILANDMSQALKRAERRQKKLGLT